MEILRAYLDSSGEDTPQHKVCSIAGFVTTVKKWRKFEKLWKQRLRDFKVPYLHMRQFVHYKPPFDIFWDAELRKEKPERVSFLQTLTNIMEETDLRGIMSVVRLADIRRFNQEKGLNIDVLAFNLYILMGILALAKPNDQIEFIIDKLTKPGYTIEKAREYADTDINLNKCTDRIKVNIIGKDLSFKEIVPIQAADFLAWEIRKLIDSRDEWYNKFKTGDDPKIWNKSVKDWSKLKGVRIRQSYENLAKQTQPLGFIWDYQGFCGNDNLRNHIWP